MRDVLHDPNGITPLYAPTDAPPQAPPDHGPHNRKAVRAALAESRKAARRRARSNLRQAKAGGFAKAPSLQEQATHIPDVSQALQDNYGPTIPPGPEALKTIDMVKKMINGQPLTDSVQGTDDPARQAPDEPLLPGVDTYCEGKGVEPADGFAFKPGTTHVADVGQGPSDPSPDKRMVRDLITRPASPADGNPSIPAGVNWRDLSDETLAAMDPTTLWPEQREARKKEMSRRRAAKSRTARKAEQDS